LEPHDLSTLHLHQKKEKEEKKKKIMEIKAQITTKIYHKVT
jgi:hypothetical protein